MHGYVFELIAISDTEMLYFTFFVIIKRNDRKLYLVEYSHEIHAENVFIMSVST